MPVQAWARMYRYHIAYWVRLPGGEWTPAWAEMTLSHMIHGPSAVRAVQENIEARWRKTKPGVAVVVQVHSWQRYETEEES